MASAKLSFMFRSDGGGRTRQVTGDYPCLTRTGDWTADCFGLPRIRKGNAVNDQ
jgi:hypothetical protein